MVGLQSLNKEDAEDGLIVEEAMGVILTVKLIS
jgi:hypothetical protein